MRRLLLFILMVMIVITSCGSTNEKLISKIEKTYEKYGGYKCRTNIRVISEEMETKYLIEEEYKAPNEYKLEILEPEESQGIIISSIEDKIFIEHPSINQSISLTAIKSLNRQMLMGTFLEDISKADNIVEKEMDGEKYIIFKIGIEEKNNYRDTAEIWIHKKDYIPYKLNIFDSSGTLQLEIIYEDFKFIGN